MELSTKQTNRANRFHIFLKKQNDLYFEETKISKCEVCSATGLNGFRNLSDGGFSWDTINFCDNCNGIGYIGLAGGIQIDLINYICKRCDGIGCNECKFTGIEDWISHAMG